MKKFLALTLSAALALSSVSLVFADVSEDLDDITDPVEISGEGTPLGIDDEDITVFTVPTDGAFDFFLDPQGLTTIEAGDKGLLAGLEGGRIVLKGDAPAFINNCGFDVNVVVDIAVIEGSLDNLVDDIEDLIVADEANALIYAQPSLARINEVEYNNFVPTEKGIVLGATNKLTFALPAAAYEVTAAADNAYTAAIIEDSGFGSALMIGGYLDPDADYSGVEDAKIDVTITVTKEKINDTVVYAEAEADAGGIAAYGLTKPAADYITVDAHVIDRAPSTYVSTSVWNPVTGGTAELRVDFGAGKLAATGLDLDESTITLTIDESAEEFGLNGAAAGGFVELGNGFMIINESSFELADSGSDMVISIEFTNPDDADGVPVANTVIERTILCY